MKPESIESRYQRAQRLAQQSSDRASLYMKITLGGIVGTLLTIAYVNEKYYPLTTTWEEIQKGQIDPSTETALWASMGIVAFELFCVASTLAAGYNTFRYVKHNRNAKRLREEIERQSKLPPTLKP